MIKVLIDQKVVKLNSLNDLDLETLVTKCKSYDDDGDGIILGIVPVTSEWKEYYENRFGESVDYTIGYGDYLD